MFNNHDINRNTCQLFGSQANCGYDWWWHSFTGYHKETGEEKSFFVEFFACNPAGRRYKPVLGQLPINKILGIKPSYVMIKCGAWGEDALQLHRYFGWKNVKVNKSAPFKIKAEDCFLTETAMKGKVSVSKEDAERHPEWMCDAGEMEFRLKIKKDIAFNVGYGASNLFRKLQAFEMFWHAEGMKTLYSGEVILNGETYIVRPKDCYGYADKNWGKSFTSPWVWLSSNDLTSEITGKKLKNSVFDIGGGRPKIGPVALPRKLLSAFYYEGMEFEFNFTKFYTGARTKFACKETETQIRWHVVQKTFHTRLVCDVTCEKKDMLLINYEAPNGEKRHNRLWNGGNGKGTIELYYKDHLVDRVHAEHIGCEYGEYEDVDF